MRAQARIGGQNEVRTIDARTDCPGLLVSRNGNQGIGLRAEQLDIVFRSHGSDAGTAVAIVRNTFVRHRLARSNIVDVRRIVVVVIVGPVMISSTVVINMGMIAVGMRVPVVTARSDGMRMRATAERKVKHRRENREETDACSEVAVC